ncbi:MAG: DUF3798 domain-containing protein [Treponema sp.]|nr:DUF3798 domain-containing protein [Treponema sp.]
MKRLLLVVSALVLIGAFVFAAGSSQPASPGAAAAPKYHIGIMTGTVSQSDDDLRGAEELMRRYGKVSEGGIIQHVTYPDNFMAQQETMITQLTTLADDPLMKAIIMNQAVPGTAEGFKRIKEKRPDILLFAGQPQEDPLVIQKVANLAINADFVSRGYTIPWICKQLGCDTFVHISFPRHMSSQTLGLRRQIFEEACKDLGIKFVFVTAPDPTSDVGIAGAQQFILEQTPQWVATYGKKSAYFATNDAHTEPLIKQLMKYGGYFPEASLPAPIMGYPGALGVDLSAEKGNFPAILKKVEKAVIDQGGSGRFGTWAYSYGFSVSLGFGEYAKAILDGKAKVDSMQDLFKYLSSVTPGAEWKGNYYQDPATGIRARNQVLVYMDTYIFGKGYMKATDVVVPEKYYNIKFQKPN